MYVRVFEGLCRVCLQHWAPVSVLTPLVQDHKLTDHATAVLTFANIQIQPDDGLPDKICPSCIGRLKQAIRFKLTCERSHERLAEMKKRSEEDLKLAVVRHSVREHFDVDSGDVSAGEEPGVAEEYAAVRPEERSVGMKKSARQEAELKRRSEDLKLAVIGHSVREHFDVDSGDVSAGEESGVAEECAPVRREEKSVEVEKEKEVAVNRTKLPDGRMQCDICNQIVSCRSSLKNHINRKHSDSYKFMCEECGRGFKERSDLRRHLSIAHQHPKKYACKLCDYKANCRTSVKTHMSRHGGDRSYKCGLCDKSFFSRQVHRMHQSYHQEKKFTCDRCPKTFHRKSDLASHYATSHERKYLYRCSFTECQTAFKKPGTVRRHLAKVHGVARSLQGPVKRVPCASVKTLQNNLRLRPNSVEILPALIDRV